MTVTNTTQYANGKTIEQFLDTFFARRGWQIEPTTPHEERTLCLGDRWYTKPGKRLAIEYKSGEQTYYTGNIFLETVSVDTANKPGWVYTCKAAYVLYACTLNKKILVFEPDKLRDKMPMLKTQFREAATNKGQNKGYKTHGLIVPLEYAERHIASRVIIIEE